MRGGCKSPARSGLASGAVPDAAFVMGAVRTAIKLAGDFDAVPDDPALAMGAGRRDGVNGALEAVEDHGPAVRAHQLEGLVILVAAYIASRHGAFPVSGAACRRPWRARPWPSTRAPTILPSPLRN